ncbi:MULTISPECIES: GNAT family N-acetyltransferase [Bacillaceae]|uniref:GNAT family N-acetyltransferase n=1 Tax=Bacillaceae TaxID=186817 RepID=UPI000BFB822B|nr:MULTISPECIES: GNAT family N-acetyltransferase [Bacillaceae]PGT84449.1 GNAT family N-acetyltransferase [Bacillus sp. AFS040349]UGB32953.1 GNAT family N-acetyltransferase [Metabacillus sp. B2-18]
MKIRALKKEETPPIQLLLLADPSVSIIEDYLNRGMCFVAENQENMVIGVLVLLPTRPHSVELANISVSEDYRGKGVGKLLIKHAISVAREKLFKVMEVGTGNSSIDQIAFYQKCGFRLTGVDFDFFVKHYDEPIYENNIQCRDMVRFTLDIE